MRYLHLVWPTVRTFTLKAYSTCVVLTFRCPWSLQRRTGCPATSTCLISPRIVAHDMTVWHHINFKFLHEIKCCPHRNFKFYCKVKFCPHLNCQVFARSQVVSPSQLSSFITKSRVVSSSISPSARSPASQTTASTSSGSSGTSLKPKGNKSRKGGK